MTKNIQKEFVIYQAKSGAIQFRGDFDHDTVWGNLNQISELFGRDNSVISRHIKNIFKSGELKIGATVAKIATVQKEGDREVLRDIEYYNLDVILSVGYRVDSKHATQFRIWATKTLKQHLIDGYTINKKRIGVNYAEFMRAVSDVKALLPVGMKPDTGNILELIKVFANTWFLLDAYDKETLPKRGATKKRVSITADELTNALFDLKQALVAQKEANELFGAERQNGSIAGIVGNVLQSFGGADLYPTVEDKAAHLLYFMVKNHPFTDGNKRSGAFSFVWFLRKAKILDTSRISPEALTAITLLIAESNPKDKDKMTGLVLLLLKK